MQVFVENSHTNKIITLEVEPGDTIKNVRDKIPKGMLSNEEGIPADDYCLNFANQTLKDCQTISDCKIEKGSKLLLVRPLPSSMMINVRIPDGRIIDLQVSTSCTIENVKAKIHDEALIPTYQHCLMFAGKILEDEHTLQDYNICWINGQEGYRFNLELILRVKMQIFVENSHTNKIITLDIKPCDTIKNVRDKIPEAMFMNEEGIPSDDHRLIFASKRLRDCQTISDCKIEKGSKLLLLWPLPSSIWINSGTQTPYGKKIIDLQISTNCTIENIKGIIHDKLEIHPYQDYYLTFAGEILEDGHTLQDYNIRRISNQEGYRLYLELRWRETMQIFVKTLTGETLAFGVDPRNTIKSLKGAIEREKDIPASLQRIIFDKKTLKDSRTFSDYNIKNESILLLLYCANTSRW